TQAYQNAAEAKSAEGMKVDDDITRNKKLCPTLKEKNASLVEDGINDLTKALQLRPDYDDAMAYMNLLYRRKAELECGDPAARDGRRRSGLRVICWWGRGLREFQRS